MPTQPPSDEVVHVLVGPATQWATGPLTLDAVLDRAATMKLSCASGRWRIGRYRVHDGYYEFLGWVKEV